MFQRYAVGTLWGTADMAAGAESATALDDAAPTRAGSATAEAVAAAAPPAIEAGALATVLAPIEGDALDTAETDGAGSGCAVSTATLNARLRLEVLPVSATGAGGGRGAPGMPPVWR